MINKFSVDAWIAVKVSRRVILGIWRSSKKIDRVIWFCLSQQLWSYRDSQLIKANFSLSKKVSEYDQEIPQSQTADNPIAS